MRDAGDFGVGDQDGASYCGIADSRVLECSFVPATVLGVDYCGWENCGSDF